MPVFAEWQPIYAARGIATFPVDAAAKKPLIRSYARVGLKGSSDLAAKFPGADALAFIAGARSRIAVLDIDSTDEAVCREAIARVGESPVVIETASGKYHVYFKHNGEGRRIRPWADLPVDILGGGLVIAPPSLRGASNYQFVLGSLDQVESLPVMRSSWESASALKPNDPEHGATEGNRNDTIWRAAMRFAHRCTSQDELVDFARRKNLACIPPLTDGEVVKIATSAWGMTIKGLNLFGRRRVEIAIADAALLVEAQNHDALRLFVFLRIHNGPTANFFITNSLHHTFGWTEKRLAKARQRLFDIGYIERLRGASSFSGPAVYGWRRRTREEEGEGEKVLLLRMGRQN